MIATPSSPELINPEAIQRRAQRARRARGDERAPIRLQLPTQRRGGRPVIVEVDAQAADELLAAMAGGVTASTVWL